MVEPQPRTRPVREIPWEPTPQSFEAMLRWLDGGADSEGQNYLAIRDRLVTFFERKGCANADDLADETLTRVQRRLEEEGAIETDSPPKYCYTVARYVFLEDLRSGRRREVSIEHEDGQIDLPDASGDSTVLEERVEKERTLDCLEKCAAELEPEKREMIVKYYTGRQREKIENRREIAAKMGLSMNALAIRTFRIRGRLERCVSGCVESAK